MKKAAGATVLALGMTVSSMTAMSAATATTPTSNDATVSVDSSTSDHAKKRKCATRKKYKRIDVKGRDASTKRKVAKIMGFRGKRDRISHSGGQVWETRTYRHCGSKILKVYVNYKGKKAYFKTGKP